MQGFHPCTPLKPFLKEGFKNPKNFQKLIFDSFLKVLERGMGETSFKGFHPCSPLKPFLKEGFKNPKNF